MKIISNQTLKNRVKILLLSLALLLCSIITIAQDSAKFHGATSSFSDKPARLKIGLGLGYGYTNVRSGGYKPLLRPSASLRLNQMLSPKNQLSYKLSYRSFGDKYSPTIFNGQTYQAYAQLDFIGVSLTYLRPIKLQLPLFFGAGISTERLLKDRIVTTYPNGESISVSSYQTYKKMNVGGQFVGQYRPKLSKRLETIIELEYAFGLLNYFKPIATQTTGRKTYLNGLFVTVGAFF
ncbi:hypothetical protein [Runella limosa]|uniref:hypothetical protein n=1 Tax=Runella limosa TaxID=370978 RepID=UPI00041F94D0|nr:hypothetical protein [Runella limosa]